MNVLAPTPSLLTKLGSIAVHAREYLSPFGHRYDRAALESILADPEVRSWLLEMDSMSLLPRERSRDGQPTDNVEGE